MKKETLVLSESNKDVLAEFGNISIGSAATSISKLLDKKVSITTPTVWTSKVTDLQKMYPNPCVIVSIEYVSGLQGTNLLIIKESDARIIADLMMGDVVSETDEKLSEIQLSAVSECMNQMMGSSSTALSQLLNVSIVISPPSIKYVDLGEGYSDLRDFIHEENVVAIAFRMEIEGFIESELVQVIPIEFAEQVVETLLNSIAIMEISDTHGDIDEDMPVKEREEDKNSDLRMAMIKNLPLRVSVLLGKTKMPLGEILQLSPGYVVELDRFENEPVDILINDRIIAKGEVILVDDQFGVRILKILGPGEEGLLRNQPV